MSAEQETSGIPKHLDDVLRLAEESQQLIRQMEKRSLTATLAIIFPFILIALGIAWVYGTYGVLIPLEFKGPTVVAGVAALFFTVWSFSLALSALGRVRRDLRAESRAFKEAVGILHEVEDSNRWDVLERARFRIRLSRLALEGVEPSFFDLLLARFNAFTNSFLRVMTRSARLALDANETLYRQSALNASRSDFERVVTKALKEAGLEFDVDESGQVIVRQRKSTEPHSAAPADAADRRANS